MMKSTPSDSLGTVSYCIGCEPIFTGYFPVMPASPIILMISSYDSLRPLGFGPKHEATKPSSLKRSGESSASAIAY